MIAVLDRHQRIHAELGERPMAIDFALRKAQDSRRLIGDDSGKQLLRRCAVEPGQAQHRALDRMGRMSGNERAHRLDDRLRKTARLGDDRAIDPQLHSGGFRPVSRKSPGTETASILATWQPQPAP